MGQSIESFYMVTRYRYICTFCYSVSETLTNIGNITTTTTTKTAQLTTNNSYAHTSCVLYALHVLACVCAREQTQIKSRCTTDEWRKKTHKIEIIYSYITY